MARWGGVRTIRTHLWYSALRKNGKVCIFYLYGVGKMRPDRPWNIFCMEWKRCVRIVRGCGLLLAVFGNDTVWAGMGNGSVIPEVAMGTWQTVEGAAMNAGWCVDQRV